jgi:histidinol dehydrogenase
MQLYVWNELGPAERRRVLSRPALADDASVRAKVAGIIERVRADGDRALVELAQELDGARVGALEVTGAEFSAAEARLDAAAKQAIRAAAANIETFHRAQLPAPLRIETAPGVSCERVWRPLRSVGLYVPAGSAPLPSTALMLGIPARLAGCPVCILCSPPRADGSVDPAVLYAAQTSGIAHVFKIGGAQAIAAMAYGTASVPKVDKVFGPGSVWVTEAKAQVERDPEGAARDYPAGPSEVLVIADARARADFVAADLLSQAEHGADSQVVLVTTSAALGYAVMRAIDEQKLKLARRKAIDGALAHSSIVVVDDVAEALELANAYAPEHLILQVESPRLWLDGVQSAGSVFLGTWAPESVGDYCSGTNHVLPTYGYAHRYSSLGVGDFLRAMTVQELSREGLENIGPVAVTLARLEGLDAHAEAVLRRLSSSHAAGEPS